MDAFLQAFDSSWMKAVIAIGGIYATVDSIRRIYTWAAATFTKWREKTKPKRAASVVRELTVTFGDTQLYLFETSSFIAEIVSAFIKLVVAGLFAVGMVAVWWSTRASMSSILNGFTLGVVAGTFSQTFYRLWRTFLLIERVRRFHPWAEKALDKIVENAEVMECPAQCAVLREAAVGELRLSKTEGDFRGRPLTRALSVLFYIAKEDVEKAEERAQALVAARRIENQVKEAKKEAGY